MSTTTILYSGQLCRVKDSCVDIYFFFISLFIIFL